MLAIGKRVGLSLAEMNELRAVDLLDMARSYVGEKQEQSERRTATQADIDAFYGG